LPAVISKVDACTPAELATERAAIREQLHLAGPALYRPKHAQQPEAEAAALMEGEQMYIASALAVCAARHPFEINF
jgi:hypothetical protein